MQTGKEGVDRRMQSVSISQQAAEEPGSNNSSGSSGLLHGVSHKVVHRPHPSKRKP